MTLTTLAAGLSWYDKLVEKFQKVNYSVGERFLMPFRL